MTTPINSLQTRKCPWPDYVGNPIHAGDVIVHPANGERGVVVFLAHERDIGDAWRVRYEDGTISRLCLQLGDKGRAVVGRGAA